MNKLTAIIPTKNEQDFLDNCLKSVAFADEIIVIDSGSTDQTLQIAQKHRARIINHPWQGFRQVHDFAATKAQHDWLLYLDADERVSRQLKLSIQTVLAQPLHDAYQLKRLNYFMGRPMKHGGWYPDPMTRLIKKSSLKGWVGQLHEYPQINGTIGNLSGHLFHLTHRDLTWSLHKTISYTEANAQLLYRAGHPQVRVRNFFGAMAREFFYRAIRTAGWRDGLVGWYEIIYQTFNAFLIQVYLWQLQQRVSLEDKYHQIDQQISKDLVH